MNNVSRTAIAASAAMILTFSLGAGRVCSQEPDNSRQNQTQMPTADDQNNTKEDRLIAANVRKAIIGDKNLSMYAHNVKIITHGGRVTLKGPVKSAQEKQQVFDDAASAVAAANISNELTVKE